MTHKTSGVVGSVDVFTKVSNIAATTGASTAVGLGVGSGGTTRGLIVKCWRYTTHCADSSRVFGCCFDARGVP